MSGEAALKLLQPCHGSVEKIAATFFRPLAVGILGLQPGNSKKRQAAGRSVRSSQSVKASNVQLVLEASR